MCFLVIKANYKMILKIANKKYEWFEEKNQNHVYVWLSLTFYIQLMLILLRKNPFCWGLHIFLTYYFPTFIQELNMGAHLLFKQKRFSNDIGALNLKWNCHQ